MAKLWEGEPATVPDRLGVLAKVRKALKLAHDHNRREPKLPIAAIIFPRALQLKLISESVKITQDGGAKFETEFQIGGVVARVIVRETFVGCELAGMLLMMLENKIALVFNEGGGCEAYHPTYTGW